MTKKQIIEAMAPFPDDMDVYFSEVETGFKYNPVETVEAREINFLMEPGDKPPFATEIVIILDGI